MRPFSSLLLLGLLLPPVVAGAQEGNPRRSPVVEAVESAGSSVVNVYTEEMVARRDWSGDFFRDILDPKYKRKMETTSLGSGTIIDTKGHVLTNFHVVQRGAKIKVALVDHREYEAKVVGTDPDLDLAVLKLQTQDKLPFMPMGDSNSLMIGETVIAIGNPFGLSNTVTTGVVSALHRNLNAGGRTYHDFVQTDASINPGNSGGPLLNIEGELIGINTAIYGPGASIGIGFAIPVNRARRIVEDLIAYGRIRQAYVGVDLTEMKGESVKKLKLPQKTAVRVAALAKGGPAQKGGLRVGDIILSVEGFPIETPEDYTAKMRDYTAGDTISMRVLRADKKVKVVIVATEVPLALADRIVEGQLGMRVRGDGGAGVVINTVKGGLPAARERLRRGDRILRVNGEDIKNLDAFRRAVLRARRHGEISLLVKRGRRVGEIRFKL